MGIAQFTPAIQGWLIFLIFKDFSSVYSCHSLMANFLNFQRFPSAQSLLPFIEGQFSWFSKISVQFTPAIHLGLIFSIFHDFISFTPAIHWWSIFKDFHQHSLPQFTWCITDLHDAQRLSIYSSQVPHFIHSCHSLAVDFQRFQFSSLLPFIDGDFLDIQRFQFSLLLPFFDGRFSQLSKISVSTVCHISHDTHDALRF